MKKAKDAVEKTAVQGRVSVDSPYFYTWLIFVGKCRGITFSGQVADWTGNNCHSMSLIYQVLGDLMVPGASRFIECSKSLVDEKYMHKSG